MTTDMIKAFWKNHKEKIEVQHMEMESPLKRRYFFVSSSPFMNNRFITSFSDITTRKLAEIELRESYKRFATTFDYAPLPMTLSDPKDGAYRDVNRMFCQVSGYRREEALGKTSLELGLIQPADRKKLIGILETEGRVTDLELTLTAKDQRTVHCVYSGEILNFKNEQLLLSTAQDITARKQAETALRVSEERHRTILQTAMDGFWVTDMQGRLLEVNESYCRMSGYSAGELLTMHISDVEAFEEAADIVIHRDAVIIQGEDRFETRHRSKDGRIFEIEVSVQYRPDEGGRFVAFLRDITERKRVEAELNAAKNAAETANQAKTKFLTSMSHELRTPLNGILGYAQILKRDPKFPENYYLAIDTIERSGEHLLKLNRHLS